MFKRETGWFRLKKLNGLAVFVYIVLTVSSVWSAPVFAIGMGAAMADSQIGEPLSVHIPIFNVKDPSNLSVILQRTEATVSAVPLQAKVEYLNFQLAIRVTSKQPTTEPYVSFVVEVVDGADVSSKNFTVLLDLQENTQTVNLRTGSRPFESASQSNPVTATPLTTSVSGGSLMGPYDWAKAGQVAEKFGPVLDGQSLWRVARRINQALGVSIDQMMWSLYQNNRDQFASDSITSLRAGAILRIPSAEQVSRLTERQAKEQVQRASKANFSANPRPATSQAPVAESKPAAQPETVSKAAATKAKKQSTSESPAFDLTGLGDAGNLSGASDGIGGQSQQIIASLAEAVGNLTQEVIKKDKKISFLEEKIAALEEYAQVNSTDLVPEQADTRLALAQTSEQSVAIDERSELRVENFSFLHFLLIGLSLLVLTAFLFRDRLIILIDSLNLSGKSNQIDFDPSMFEHTESVQVFDAIPPAVEPVSEMTVTVEANPTPQAESSLSRRSILDAIKTAVQTEDPLSPQTLMDLDGEFSYTEMLSEATYSITESNLSFMERFEKAMLQRDFGYASQLLNFARESELDLPHYHYHRLRLFEAMNDEDAFYDYYCEVEQMVPSYNTELQTKISQLVLSMAQQ